MLHKITSPPNELLEQMVTIYNRNSSDFIYFNEPLGDRLIMLDNIEIAFRVKY